MKHAILAFAVWALAAVPLTAVLHQTARCCLFRKALGARSSLVLFVRQSKDKEEPFEQEPRPELLYEDPEGKAALQALIQGSSRGQVCVFLLNYFLVLGLLYHVTGRPKVPRYFLEHF
jgi:hypothetical protein